MEIITGALPDVLTKLGELLVGEYNLQKGVKGEIRFLQAELESMLGALEDISNSPTDMLDNHDKIWARDVRELSYDIEDSIDTFTVHGQDSEQVGLLGFKKFIDRCFELLTSFQIRRNIATEIRDIKRRVIEVCDRRGRYKINVGCAKPSRTTIDPRLMAHYTEVTELVGIDEARDELIKIIMDRNEKLEQSGKIVSIVGFGGIGKTTIANVVYEKLRAQFECWAFVSVSQTPDVKKLFKSMLCDLGKNVNFDVLDERHLINELREFLRNKRYFIVVDDIWDLSVWEVIRCALPDNNYGYRIIITTRIFNVAKQVGGTYKLKPLCLRNSRILLYGRIFGKGSKDKCPDEQLAEVSDKILKKCAGVPLAIITISSLLASKRRNKMEWYEIFYSIGTGMENSHDLEKMRMILSLSYYNLPSHLRTCLLYLSVFPEDYEICKNRLIWMWIAEGFIRRENQGQSLLKIGESYFNELINRSLIQPVYDEYDNFILRCRVHDMVLDLIHSLSREANFITILNGTDHRCSNKMVRRLSLQNSKAYNVMYSATIGMNKVRSVLFFPSAANLQPPLSTFRVLRILDLEDCKLSQDSNLKYLGNLYHLKYLGLRNTRISQLPEEIGNLLFLQLLDIEGNEIPSLPPAVVRLRQLLCLRIKKGTRVPNGIRSLTSLEELSVICIDDDSMDVIEELGYLMELRVLHIFCRSKCIDTFEKSLVECLCKLQKLQSLHVWISAGECSLDAWSGAPPCLNTLQLPCSWFSTMPHWINPSLLLDLSFLWISVRELQQEDLDILGRLPALRFLDLKVEHQNLGILREFTIGSCSFPCLVWCELHGFGGHVVFEKGAMPILASLSFEFHVRVAREIAVSEGGFYLGFENLQSLQRVIISFLSEGTSVGEMQEAKALVKREAEIHPNNPTVWIP